MQVQFTVVEVEVELGKNPVHWHSSVVFLFTENGYDVLFFSVAISWHCGNIVVGQCTAPSPEYFPSTSHCW